MIRILPFIVLAACGDPSAALQFDGLGVHEQEAQRAVDDASKRLGFDLRAGLRGWFVSVEWLDVYRFECNGWASGCTESAPTLRQAWVKVRATNGSFDEPSFEHELLHVYFAARYWDQDNAHTRPEWSKLR